MVIATQDDIVAGMQQPFLFFKPVTTTKGLGIPHAIGLRSAGIPSVFTPGTPGLAGANIDGTSNSLGGTFPFTNPGSGSTYLSRFCINGGVTTAAFKLFDLVWYNSGIGITTTTAQTVNSVTFPARDANGATSGVAYVPYLYCHTATTNAGAIANTTISYTNSSGTSGRTGTISQSWPISATAGTFLPFQLAGSDVGVQSIQSVTLGTSYVTGQVHLMVVREIITMSLTGVSCGLFYDWGQTGLPQLYNGTALSFSVLPTSTSVGQAWGDIGYVQG